MPTPLHSYGFAAGLSTRQDTGAATSEVCQQVRSQLGSEPPDLAAVFFSAEHVPQTESLARDLCQQLGTRHVIGCSGEAIVGGNREIEGGPALSVWAARLANTRIVPMQLQFSRTPEGGAILGWPDDLPQEWPATAALLTLADPYTFPAEVLLELVNEEHPGIPVLGGMASAASQPRDNRLLIGERVVDHGAVAVLLQGGVQVRSLVSQGCRPIGHPLVITRAERNVIIELGGKPAYQRLVEIFQSLATSEQDQVRRGLHVGRVVDEYRDHFQQGDFLVRNVLGMDVNSGAIVVGDYVRAGQTIQFHVRDWETADGELRQLLAAYREPLGSTARGALLFTCNGRGTKLFPEPNHDAQAIHTIWEGVPLAGFFAAGELGPVGGQNFIHGFTACVALFETPANAGP